MCRSAKHPGRHVSLWKEDPTNPMDRPPATFLQLVLSIASWARQQLWQVALLVASWWARERLLQAFGRPRPAASSKEVWSLGELGLGAEIGCGRTGHVYEGRINGQRVAVKVCSWALLPLGDKVVGAAAGVVLSNAAAVNKA